MFTCPSPRRFLLRKAKGESLLDGCRRIYTLLEQVRVSHLGGGPNTFERGNRFQSRQTLRSVVCLTSVESKGDDVQSCDPPRCPECGEPRRSGFRQRSGSDPHHGLAALGEVHV